MSNLTISQRWCSVRFCDSAVGSALPQAARGFVQVCWLLVNGYRCVWDFQILSALSHVKRHSWFAPRPHALLPIILNKLSKFFYARSKISWKHFFQVYSSFFFHVIQWEKRGEVMCWSLLRVRSAFGLLWYQAVRAIANHSPKTASTYTSKTMHACARVFKTVITCSFPKAQINCLFKIHWRTRNKVGGVRL